jgi:hypothetical protein
MSTEHSEDAPVVQVKENDKDTRREDAPVVQVKEIVQDTHGFSIVVPCCWCFEDHWHGPGCDIQSEIPDSFGHREVHCSNRLMSPGRSHGYNISSNAWKKAGRRIMQKSDFSSAKRRKTKNGH